MNDDFEKRLQRQPVRPVPSAWREEILGAARQAAPRVHTRREASSDWLVTIRQVLSFLFRPQRAGWTGLAAVWVVIIALHLAARDDSAPAPAMQAANITSPETLRALRQQRLLLTELVGRPEDHPPTRQHSAPPGPRSQRRETAVAV